MNNPQNLLAFGEMLAWSEIGPELLQVSDDGYNVVVGSTFTHPILFPSYAEHPRIFNPRMNSDAAGRWQFMGKYWGYYKQFLALPDFGKDSQRKWMIQLVIECQALTDIDDGNISLAISKCSSRWASLPGNHYGQPQQILSDLLRQYSLAGGILNEESTTSPA